MRRQLQLSAASSEAALILLFFVDIEKYEDYFKVAKQLKKPGESNRKWLNQPTGTKTDQSRTRSEPEAKLNAKLFKHLATNSAFKGRRGHVFLVVCFYSLYKKQKNKNEYVHVLCHKFCHYEPEGGKSTLAHLFVFLLLSRSS